MEFFLTSEDDDDRPIFITGNFNKWNPKDSKFRLEKVDDKNYHINIPDELLNDEIEYSLQKAVGKMSNLINTTISLRTEKQRKRTRKHKIL